MSREFDSELVRRLASLLDETGLGEIEYAQGDWRIRVARPAAPTVAPAPPPAAPAAPVVEEAPQAAENPAVLRSPMVGTAYLTPDPQSPQFVSVGSTVRQGDTVMIIEAMKVMNTIAAHQAGVVREILVVSGQPVEFGQGLMVIE